MLPPALGGLRFRVPPVPDRLALGSMEKIKLSCGHPQDDEIIQHSPFRRQITKQKIKRGEIRLWCGRNRISPDDRREEPRSISTDLRSLPKAVARVVALCGVRIYRGKADGTECRPYQDDATDVSRRSGRLGDAPLAAARQICRATDNHRLLWQSSLDPVDSGTATSRDTQHLHRD